MISVKYRSGCSTHGFSCGPKHAFYFYPGRCRRLTSKQAWHGLTYVASPANTSTKPGKSRRGAVAGEINQMSTHSANWRESLRRCLEIWNWSRRAAAFECRCPGGFPRDFSASIEILKRIKKTFKIMIEKSKTQKIDQKNVLRKFKNIKQTLRKHKRA